MLKLTTSPAAAIAATRRAVGLPQDVRLRNGVPAQIRAVRPNDANCFGSFVARLPAASREQRFGRGFRVLTTAMLVDLLNVDGIGRAAFVATLRWGHEEQVIGEARYDVDENRESATLTLFVADIWQGQGLGELMLEHLLEAARDGGVRRLVGSVAPSNRPMLRLMQRMGFVARAQGADRLLRMERAVAEQLPQPRALRPRDVLRRLLNNQLFQFSI